MRPVQIQVWSAADPALGGDGYQLLGEAHLSFGGPVAPSDQWLELTDGRHAVGRVHVQYTVIAAGDEFPDDDPVPAPNSTRPLVEQRARTAGPSAVRHRSRRALM
mmetsp:Transcript_34146/g.56077  ORF Transcript_34146/g.56077 Transcript_34146/m.56077 type:complete len:105 (+) Transcript_34146:1-315(+)